MEMEMEMEEDYYGFFKGPFSNWYPSNFEVEGIKYCCMEQYLMASKARLFGDQRILRWIMLSFSPKEIKALGRKVSGFSQAVWDKNKIQNLEKGLHAKFSQNEPFKEFLLKEEGILVNCDPSDLVWGAGIGMVDIRLDDPNAWPGENLLGFSLMQVRKQLAEEEEIK